MRNQEIDCLKGILTIQMILAHCLQFFCDLSIHKGWYFISEYINLTTFPGFVFAFGFAAYGAYFKKTFLVAYKKILINIGKMMAAFYISSFAYVIYIEKMPYRLDKVLEILYVKRLAGWSEFLIAFAAVMILCFVFYSVLKNGDKRVLLIIGELSAAACFLPRGEGHPLVGIFIGGYGNAYFPAVQYFMYFIIGISFSKYEIKWNPKVLLVAGAGSGIFLYMLKMYGLPQRFPISFYWLVGSMLFVYNYYLLAIKLSQYKISFMLSCVGKNSLFYLLMSNIIIFSLKRTSFYKISVDFSIGLWIILICMIYYMAKLGSKDRDVRRWYEDLKAL